MLILGSSSLFLVTVLIPPMPTYNMFYCKYRIQMKMPTKRLTHLCPHFQLECLTHGKLLLG